MEEILAAKRAQRDHLKVRRDRIAHDFSLQREKVQAMEEDIALAVARERDDIARMLIRRKYPLAILSWVRSGLCFPGPPGRVVVREALICSGGGILVQALMTHNAVSGALGIWLFFLVQALFFVRFDTGNVDFAAEAAEDPFERARQRTEDLLARY